MTSTRIIDSRPLLLERFEVIKVLGEGAAGAVYKVYDNKRARKVVALKVLTNEEAFDEHTRLRFQKEWEVSHRLSHLRLVEAYDFIELNDAVAYTMEYIEGKDLSYIVKSDELSFKQIDKIFGQILDVMKYLHDNEVFHRDIKLENILLDSESNVKLSDLGLIKIRNEKKLTRTGILLGTAQYMPPEYIKKGQYDVRGDIYALGVVLYELLGGRRWLGDKAGNEVISHLIRTNFTFPPIEDRYIPQKYHSILENALHIKLKKRYQCVSEMKEAFERPHSFYEEKSHKKQQSETASKKKPLVYHSGKVSEVAQAVCFNFLPFAMVVSLVVSIGIFAFWNFSSTSVQLLEGTYEGSLKLHKTSATEKATLQVGPAGAVLISDSICKNGFYDIKNESINCGDQNYRIRALSLESGIKLELNSKNGLAIEFKGQHLQSK